MDSLSAEYGGFTSAKWNTKEKSKCRPAVSTKSSKSGGGPVGAAWKVSLNAGPKPLFMRLESDDVTDESSREHLVVYDPDSQLESIYDIPRTHEASYATFLGGENNNCEPQTTDEDPLYALARQDNMNCVRSPICLEYEETNEETPCVELSNTAEIQTAQSSEDVDVSKDARDVVEDAPADVEEGIAKCEWKPTIPDFKIAKQRDSIYTKAWKFKSDDPATRKARKSAVLSKSAENVQLNLLQDATTGEAIATAPPRSRASTFAVPSESPTGRIQSVYLDMGEYQAFLGHGMLDGERTDDGYKLPESMNYGNDTLKAVEVVTQKFDSFRMRQLRARSFRQMSSRTRSSDGSSDGVLTNRMSKGSGVSHESLQNTEVFSAGVTPDETPSEANMFGNLSDKELERMNIFYRSHESEVFVARCMVDVYSGALPKMASGIVNDESYVWIHTMTGIPVLVFNTGLDPRRNRELIVIVAQRDTGLALWQDRITYMINYRETGPGLHTMQDSGSASKAVQLRWYDEDLAKEFHEKINQYITINKDDEMWKLSDAQNQQSQQKQKPSKKKQEKQLKKKKSNNNSGPMTESCGSATTLKPDGTQIKRRSITKQDISRPCDLRHVTNVDATDSNFRSAFSELLPELLSKRKQGSVVVSDEQLEEFRPRLPTN